MKEGLRRIVKICSVLAWVCLFLGIVFAVLALAQKKLEMGFVGALAVTVFIVLQGFAWVLAGFAGNASDSDGLVRLSSIWRAGRSGGRVLAGNSRKPNIDPRHRSSERGAAKRFGAWIVCVIAWAAGWAAVTYFSPSRTLDPLQVQAAQYFKQPESRREFVEIMRPLMEEPIYIAAMREAAANNVNATLMGAEMAQRGMPGLPNYMLLQRTRILSKILERSDVGFCARIARGTTSLADEKRIPEILETLPHSDLVAWLQLSRAAMEFSMKGNGQLPRISEEAVEKAIQAISVGHTTESTDRLFDFLRDPAEVPDSAACDVVKDLYRRILAAPEPHKAVLARALVSD